MQNLQNIYLKFLCIPILLFLFSCNKTAEKTADKPFEITDSLLNRLRIDTVQQANAKTELMFSARITANEERKSELFPMVSGSINKVEVRLGDRVNVGQPLATIHSSEMAGFDREMISAQAELNTVKRSLKQVEQLYESGLSSAKELEEAKNDFAIKQAEFRRASAVLNLNGGSKNGLHVVKSPISGFVIEKNVTENMVLRGDYDKSLFTIADLSTVWAMINIYESDISNVQPGDEVNLFTLSYPEKIFKGKIDKIYNQIDQNTKVMNARVVISNADFLLKPGMLGTVKVSATTSSSLPVVHSRALVFDENKNYVLLLDANHKVHIRQVEIGRKTADKVYIQKGLSAGDRVISSKQVFLFESLKTQ